MKKWFLMILLAAGALNGNAAEIVAWKVPLDRYTPDTLPSPNIQRYKAAPEVSPFFKEGDELWDLNAARPDIFKGQKLPLDWLVWNASSGQLVAKGHWGDICRLDDVLRPYDLPQHCRLTMNVCEVAEDGSPMVANAKPIATMSLILKSGQDFETKWSVDGKSIEAGGFTNFGSPESAVNVGLWVDIKVPEQPSLRFNTSFVVQPDKTLWVARDFTGKKGLDVSVSAVVESLDGVPFRERRMIQKSGKAVSILAERNSLKIQSVGKQGWMISQWVSPRDLMALLSPDSAPPAVDPFAAAPHDEHVVLPPTPSVKPLAFLSPWLDHEILDANAWVEKIAPFLKGDGNFMGYDPMFGRLYFYSTKQDSVDMFEQYFTPMCNLPPPAIIVASLDGKRQTRLIAKSGQKATLERNSNEKSGRCSIEIEPTAEENGDRVVMQLDYQDEEDPNAVTRLKTRVTLDAGKPLELLAHTSSNGEKSSLRLKTEVLPGGTE